MCCGGMTSGEPEAGGLEPGGLAGGYSHDCPIDGAVGAGRQTVSAPAAAVGLHPGGLAGIHLHQSAGLANRAGSARLAPTAEVQIYKNAQHGPTIASDLPGQKTNT